MTEFSTATRVLAALLLIVVSAVAWRWLLAPVASGGGAAATADRNKKPKKKPKKKKNIKADAATSAAAPPTAVHKVDESAIESDVDSDPDAGLSAKQILAKRRFQPKAIGGISAAAAALAVERFVVGQRVVARYQDGHDWFPGEIVEVRRGNQYHIKYDDGEVEHHVPHARIKDVAAAETESDAQAHRVADAVDAGRSDADTGHDGDSSPGMDGDAGDESEDGWQVVVSAAKKKSGHAAAPVEMDKVDADGLTKRQRENRRKKERRKEVKEAVRAQAQEHGLHARWGGTMTRLKYVPPSTSTTN